jgi:choline dehydrogenase
MADFVIIGAGSAGCVLANRLSADPANNVVLLEAGGKDSSFLYRMPAGMLGLMQTGMGNWNYESVPQPSLNNRTVYFPRGKVLGGSSSINGLVVSRGNAGDYDHWAQLGNTGWSYQDVLPFFKKIENFPGGNPEFRGTGGPIDVTRVPPPEQMTPIARAWVEGAMQAGYPFNADVNESNPYGVAQMQANYKDGIRRSAAYSYLRPALGRPNLTVITGALVQRVVLAGKRAVGVDYIRKGKVEHVSAGREVILCGGAINSPQVLQLSGIGAAEDLRPYGIDVLHELPGVGENLCDHIAVSVKTRLTKPISMLNELRPLATVKSIVQYLLTHKGPTSTSGLEAWAHLNSRPGLEYPDLQLYCVLLMYNDHGRDIIKEHGFMTTLNACRPQSVGTVKIRSADPMAPPSIDPQFLSMPEDVRALREGIRLAREIAAQKTFDGLRGTEYAPGAAVQSDAEIDAYIRNNAFSIYHPVGTCKMGVDDAAVVGPDLRVHGVNGLVVADASVMPAMISGNTNFPSMMIGEKAAALILGQAGA